MSSLTRRIVVAALAALLAVALVVSMVGTAGAHNEFGAIAAEITADPDDPAEITIRVRITYTDDGHPVEDDAVVTYAVTDSVADGPFASGAMSRVGDGQYEVAVALPGPGSFTVAVTSENPEGAFETVHVLEEAAPPTTTAPAGPDDEADEGPSDDETDDGSVTVSWPVVIAIVVFLVAVGGVVFLAARRRRM